MNTDTPCLYFQDNNSRRILFVSTDIHTLSVCRQVSYDFKYDIEEMHLGDLYYKELGSALFEDACDIYPSIFASDVDKKQLLDVIAAEMRAFQLYVRNRPKIPPVFKQDQPQYTGYTGKETGYFYCPYIPQYSNDYEVRFRPSLQIILSDLGIDHEECLNTHGLDVELELATVLQAEIDASRND